VFVAIIVIVLFARICGSWLQISSPVDPENGHFAGYRRPATKNFYETFPARNPSINVRDYRRVFVVSVPVNVTIRATIRRLV